MLLQSQDIPSYPKLFSPYFCAQASTSRPNPRALFAGWYSDTVGSSVSSERCSLGDYLRAMFTLKLWKIAIEIVSFLIKDGDFP
jgi:hypothetical protein